MGLGRDGQALGLTAFGRGCIAQSAPGGQGKGQPGPRRQDGPSAGGAAGWVQGGCRVGAGWVPVGGAQGQGAGPGRRIGRAGAAYGK
jgi:hypothetical protein